jgi:hypothetical protein
VGRRVAKVFRGNIYSGTVDRYLPPDEGEEGDWWRVKYDDGAGGGRGLVSSDCFRRGGGIEDPSRDK